MYGFSKILGEVSYIDTLTLRTSIIGHELNSNLSLLEWFLSQNKSLLIPENWLPVTIRGAMMVLCMFCFFSASPILSLSQMAAGLYTFPIFVTILSIVITKEMVGKYRLIALVMGFIGSVFILQLWKEDFNLYQLLPILAGFFYACNIIMIRKY